MGSDRESTEMSDYFIHCRDENGKELCNPFKYTWQLKLNSKVSFGKQTGLWEVIKTELYANNIVNVVLKKVEKE